jgi:microcystin degradation protein MlrC
MRQSTKAGGAVGDSFILLSRAMQTRLYDGPNGLVSDPMAGPISYSAMGF